MSRRDIWPEALKVLYRLQSCGHLAYLAGGCVRDLLLHRRPKDYDVVTDAPPNRVRHLFRNCRLIGRRFRLAHIVFPDVIIEVATFRAAWSLPDEGAESPDPAPAGVAAKSREGMIVRDNLFGTPEEDALRRDFTVNGLFYNIRDFSILDYVHGLEDLNLGLIRSIGNPRTRFVEDPVRMIRAIRFAAALNFRIEERDYEALREYSPRLRLAAKSRLYEEVLKLFFCGNAERVFHHLREVGLLPILFPDFAAWLTTPEGVSAAYRIEATLRALDTRVRGDHSVSPPLFFALLFGPYHEAAAAALAAEGAHPSLAASVAVADHLKRLSSHVQIPRQTSLLVSDIMATQPKLRERRGRDVSRLPRRPFFADALEYLCVAGEVDGRSMDLARWWADHATRR